MTPFNVLLVVADQLGADIAYHDKFPFTQTPRLDSFRREAVSFSRAFSPAPVCGPARACLTTGRYPPQHGVWNNRCMLMPEERTLGHIWHESGGNAFAFGKTHGQNPGFRVMPEPSHLDSLGSNLWGPYEGQSYACDRDVEKPVPLLGVFEGATDTQYDFRVVEAVRTAFIEQRAMQSAAPLLVFAGIHGPHPPLMPPGEFAGLHNPSEIELPPRGVDSGSRPPIQEKAGRYWEATTDADRRRMIAAHLDLTTMVDQAFGRMLDGLEEAGLSDSTIVVFTADHGDQLGAHGLLGKFNCFYEECLRVPLMIRLPGAEAAETDELVSLVDILPALLSLTGRAVPGRSAGTVPASLARLVSGPGQSSVVPGARSHVLAWLEEKAGHRAGMPEGDYVKGMMIRDSRHKLALYSDGYAEFYDLAEDPHEHRNLADDESGARVRASLSETLVRESLTWARNPSMWQYNMYPG